MQGFPSLTKTGMATRLLVVEKERGKNISYLIETGRVISNVEKGSSDT